MDPIRNRVGVMLDEVSPIVNFIACMIQTGAIPYRVMHII